MVCTVTGNVKNISGVPDTTTRLLIKPSLDHIREIGGAAVVPNEVLVYPDAQGAFTVDLVPGGYTLIANNVRRPSTLFAVPDAPTAVLHTIMDLPLPKDLNAAEQSVVDARAARDISIAESEDAAISAASAQASKDASQLARVGSETARDASATSADESEADRLLAQTAASEANTYKLSSEASSVLSQDWAEKTTAPGAVGTKSSKTLAGEASASADTAAAQAGIATTQAGTATTRANEASADADATAADRVQTGLDRTQTGQDKTATAADRVATGNDKTATAADRVQTGQDVTSASTSAGTATTQAGIATTKAGEAAASALEVSQHLAAIAASKGLTAVDTCIDASPNPSLAVQARTSWYNEPLNTATRGSRREMPTTKVVIAEATKVTIYDGDDPSLPMWMVFGASFASIMGSAITDQSVAMLNGRLIIGSILYDVKCVDFAGDRGARAGTGTIFGTYLGNIAERNENKGWQDAVSFFTNGPIVNRTVNDVTMVVLPNAPVDPVSGLQIPTIAVATDGGVSVIKDDGTVVGITHSSSGLVGTVEFRSTDNALCYTVDSLAERGRFRLVRYDIPTSDLTLGTPWVAGSSDELYPMYPNSSYTGASFALSFDANMESNGFNGFADAGSLQLSLIAPNKFAPTKGMLAAITSKYNTGWMVGSIKGAFLSSTDTTSLVGQAVPISTFDGNWTDNGDGTFTSDGSSNGNIKFPTVMGKAYRLRFTIDSRTDGSLRWSRSVGTDAVATAGSYEYILVATLQTEAWIQALGFIGTISGISVEEADADRSVNAKGLAINGTIARTPVATGAELMGYSGFFTAGNYLEQPYNSALDFGTGDFCIMGWMNADTAHAGAIVDRQTVGGARLLFRTDGAGSLFLFSQNGAIDTLVAGKYGVGTWTHFAAYRKNGVLYIAADGVIAPETTPSTKDISGVQPPTTIGMYREGTVKFRGSLALLRIGATAPTADQIRKVYNDERPLFQPNAACTLYGTSDAVTALAHDPVTDLLHVGTSQGRSDFAGLRRVGNTTEPVTTAISAHDGLILEQ